MSFKDTMFLLAASQGILLSLGLITSVYYRKWAHFFLGLIILILSLEILSTWYIRMGYHEASYTFPFWNLPSYLVLPPAFYFFGKFIARPHFQILKIHRLFFAPAILEILIELLSYFSNIYLGTSIRLFPNPIWFGLTEIVPPLALVFVLFLWGMDIWALQKVLVKTYTTSTRKYLLKVLGLYSIFVLLALLWILELFFQLPAYFITLRILCIFIFALGYLSYFQPDFLRMPESVYRLASSPGQARVTALEMERIHKAFREERLFLKPKLSLRNCLNLIIWAAKGHLWNLISSNSSPVTLLCAPC